MIQILIALMLLALPTSEASNLRRLRTMVKSVKGVDTGKSGSHSKMNMGKSMMAKPAPMSMGKRPATSVAIPDAISDDDLIASGDNIVASMTPIPEESTPVPALVRPPIPAPVASPIFPLVPAPVAIPVSAAVPAPVPAPSMTAAPVTARKSVKGISRENNAAGNKAGGNKAVAGSTTVGPTKARENNKVAKGNPDNAVRKLRQGEWNIIGGRSI